MVPSSSNPWWYSLKYPYCLLVSSTNERLEGYRKKMFMTYLCTFMGFSHGGFAPNFILFLKTASIFILCLIYIMEVDRWQLAAGKWKCFALNHPLLQFMSMQILFLETHGGPVGVPPLWVCPGAIRLGWCCGPQLSVWEWDAVPLGIFTSFI